LAPVLLAQNLFWLFGTGRIAWQWTNKSVHLLAPNNQGHIWAGRDCCAALICPAQTSYTNGTLYEIQFSNIMKNY
jgi:hypothetical protein